MADLIVQEQEALGEIAKPKEKLSVIEKDPEDNRVLECAQESKADYIVSGDVHLLGIKEYAGTKILTPNEFLELLDE